MTQKVRFNPELIQRYDLTGPRYTSYPTALQFHEGFDAQLYRRHAARSNDDPIPAALSLYLHLPFCRSLCYYCGCAKKVTRRPEHGRAYLDHLQQEIGLQSILFDNDRTVDQLHFGGGTPTFFDDDQLSQLMGWLNQSFRLESGPEREFSIEIDPRTVALERLQMLAELGFNRVSLGVQDLDPRVQLAVNRVQDGEATLQMIELARSSGLGSVSVDLIYGLPLQTRASFAATLEAVIAARPDRLAVYNYAHMPHIFRAQRLIREQDLPTPSDRLALLELSISALTTAGYVYIGMDHFALPDDELAQAQRAGRLQRNFQGYSTRAGHDLIGLGASAIGKVADCYVQNRKEIPRWSHDIAAGKLPVWRGISLSSEDRIRRRAIEQIMCQGHLDLDVLSEQFHFDAFDFFALEWQQLEQLADDGLVELEEESLEVTAEGRLLLRAVAMVFDSYLQNSRRSAGAARFSRVI